LSDVIAAVATPHGTGAIGVVRVSGTQTSDVIASVFKPSKGKHPLPSHYLCHGTIVDKSGAVVDEVMCVMMYAPRSYTREDTAEVFCHGGSYTVARVLKTLLESGARPADPGEFTKRAFLNGRLDLSQAEAVMELINARTDLARRAGLRKLSGGFSKKINSFRNKILTWLAHIELSVDYPEHEEEAMNLATVSKQGQNLIDEMQALHATAIAGKRVTVGVQAVIVGRPNVGKSSLMNAILQQDRAIVTDVPGTTRDTLTEPTTLCGVPIILTDTAGIRDAVEPIEQIGVERSKLQAQTAELTLFTIDRSFPITNEDIAISQLINPDNTIILLNKSDLDSGINCNYGVKETIIDKVESMSELHQYFGEEFKKVPVINVSAKTEEGLEKLYQLVEAKFLGGELSADGDLITQARHEYLLGQAIDHLSKALSAITNGITEDIISIDLKAAYSALGEILGESVGEDILDKIFAEFCVGK